MIPNMPSIMIHLKWLIFVNLVTFSIVVPYMSSKLPFSKLYHIFNDDNFISQKAKSLNDERVKEAKQYFNAMDKDASKTFYENIDQELDLVVVIVTVNRISSHGLELGYLIQTAAVTDKLLKHDIFFKKKTLIVCNVDRKPGNHSEANVLMNYLPFVQRFGNQSPTIKKIPDQVRQHRYETSFQSTKYEKETVDYMFCLESAYTLNPKFVLLIEDDTLPHESLFEVLKYNIDTRIHHVDEKGQNIQRPFAYIKLYYPQRWQGYANELFRVMELISIACIGAGIFLFFHFACCATKRTTGIHLLYFISGAVYFLLFALIIGRQNVMELRHISKYLYSFRFSPACCTQAMLYPKQIIPSLLNFLENVHSSGSYHTDIAIYDFVIRNNMSAYQIEPNLFHHVGMYTSLNNYGPKKAEEFLFHVHI